MDTGNLYMVMKQGGVIMWPLYLLLIVATVIIVERTISLILVRKHEASHTRKELEGPLSFLDLIAVISPVLGFLGTVTGMIKAFRSVAEASSVQLQVVAAGLYEALFTTAFGLIISIVATIATHLLDHAIGVLCENEETSDNPVT